VVRHLLDLGVYEGSEITLIESINGAAVCDVKGSRLAFDHDISAGIQVAVA
jgi:Fe2+ transport system protein FeoA